MVLVGGGADALEKSHKRWQSIDSASGYPLRILLLSLFFFHFCHRDLAYFIIGHVQYGFDGKIRQVGS